MLKPEEVPNDLVDVATPVDSEAIPNDLIDAPEEENATFIEDRGQTIGVPQTFDSREIEYSMRTQLDGMAKSGFFGMQDLGGQDFMKGIVKGLAHFAISIPTAFGALMKEQGEVMPLDDKPYESALPPALFDRGAREISRQVARNTVLDEKMTEWGQKLIDWNQAFIDKVNLKPTEGQKFAFDIGSATGSVATSIGFGYLTKNPAVMAVMFGELQKASLYEEARGEGMDPRNASNLSTAGGLAEGALEFLGTNIFFKAVKVDKLLNRTLVRIAEEAIQEGAQTYAEADIMNMSGVRKDSLVKVLQNVAYSMLLGSIASAPVSTASGIFEKSAVKKELVKIGMSDKSAGRAADILIAQMEEKAANDPELHRELETIINKEASQMSVTNEERDKAAQEFLAHQAKVSGEEEAAAKKEKKISPAKKMKFEQQLNKAVEEKMSKLMEQAEELDKTKVLLTGVKSMIDQFKHRLNVSKQIDLAPSELQRIPTVFKTREGGIAADEMLAEINDQFPSLNIANESDLVDFLEQAYAKEKSLKSQVKELQPKYERREELTVLKQKLQDLKQGFREGKSAGMKEKKAAQEMALDLIQKSSLDPENKAKFLTALKNTDANNLEDFIDEFDRRAGELELKAEVRDTKQNIQEMLTGTKAKLKSGKPAGKFTPELQRLFDRAREIMKMTKQAAQDELVKNLDALKPGEFPSPEQAMENRLLQMMGGFDNKNLSELKDIENEIELLLTAGKKGAELRMLQKKARKKALVEMALRVITGTKPADPRARLSPITHNLKTGVGVAYSSMTGWSDIQDILSQDDPTSAHDASELSKEMDVSVVENEDKRATLGTLGPVIKDQMDAYGVTTEKALFKILQDNETPQDLGTFKFATGEVKPLIMSKAEAISRWMQFQQPSLMETFLDDSPGKMGYTKEIMKAISSFLSSEDKANAEALMAFYKEYLPQINSVYSERMGVNLSSIENYSPISRAVDRDPVDIFADEVKLRLSIMPSATKERVKNTHPLKQESSQKVLLRHITQMSHFMTWADKIDDINAIYGDIEVRDAIVGKFGQGMLGIIDRQVRHFTQGGIDRGNWVDTAANIVRQNFSLSVLGGKAKNAVLQLSGALAVAAEMPFPDFVSGLADYVLHMDERNAVIDATALAKDRLGGWDQDTKDILQSTVIRDFAAKYSNPLTRLAADNELTLKKMWMIFNALGDRAAVRAAGWAAYKYAYDKSTQTDPDLRKEEAEMFFVRVISQTQQSGDLSQQSDWQRGGGVLRLATQFVSAQNQYMRREVSAIRNLIKGRMSPKEAAKKLLIYHVILPQIAQVLANGGVWDDEDRRDQLRALITGSFNGAFIVYDVLNSILRAIMHENNFGRSTINVPVFSVFDGVAKAAKAMQHEEILFQDVAEAVYELTSKTVGPLTGFGFKQLFNYYDGVYDITQGSIAKGLTLLAGWGPPVAEKIDTWVKGRR